MCNVCMMIWNGIKKIINHPQEQAHASKLEIEIEKALHSSKEKRSHTAATEAPATAEVEATTPRTVGIR